MLETKLLTGLRLEGRVGVGWTRQRRPDYHPQLGAASSARRCGASTCRCPPRRSTSTCGSAAASSSRPFPAPPALDELRLAVRVRGGRRLTAKLPADTLVPSGRLLYLDRVDPRTARAGRIAAGVRFLVTPRWAVSAVYQRNLWRDPLLRRGAARSAGLGGRPDVDYV